MILSKLNKILLISFLFLIAQCYKAPFFELTVQTVGQDLNPVSNVVITIEVTDVETGDHGGQDLGREEGNRWLHAGV